MTTEQLNQIADDLDSGFKCYIHKENGTLISIPDDLRHPGINMDAWEEDMEKIDSEPGGFIVIEPMDSRESFNIMEDFVETVTEIAIHDRLAESLQRPKPFQNFKFDIDRSGPYRQKWFDYKKQRMVEWVKEQIEATSSGESN